MTTGSWPPTPPEVPPPHRPDRPEPPEPAPSPPAVPLVPTTAGASGGRRDLLERRIVLLLGPLGHDTATRAAAEVMTLDAESGDEIHVHLSCDRAELGPASMLAETLELTRSPVVVTAKSMVAGAALAVVAVADVRRMAPHALLRLCEPRESLAGTASEVTRSAEELGRRVGRLRAWIAAASGQPDEVVAEDLRRGRVLDAEEAVAYGLAHEVVQPPGGRRDRGG